MFRFACGAGHKYADGPHTTGRLRACGVGPCDHSTAQYTEELAPLHVASSQEEASYRFRCGYR